MGTIVARKRKDGSVGYTASIVRKKGGAFLWREAKTFDKQAEAKAWLRFREAELDKAGAIERLREPTATLADAIDRYTQESSKVIGKTKTQVLRSIKTFPIADMDCSEIRSDHIVAFGRDLLAGGRLPQTVGNYISHLSAIFKVARPAWGMKLDERAIEDAHVVMRKFGTTAKSSRRERRPTLSELDTLMKHFGDVRRRRPATNPMQHVIAFAIYSTRRLDEITRITWADLDEERSRVLVRDMKHPGQKAGNDVWCELPAEALQIAKAMPRTNEQIFPFSTDAVGMAFTRACQLLEIEDLHFHDLRHEGVSRLFEMGRTIPQAASVSGHRSWQSLQRYSHMRQGGDKFEGWPWLAIVSRPDSAC
ncbi:tyrosine-type recombinase/integrase [Bosea sp. (in: a-proteobacteria)]|uniref:tyrosine-type recombinase/integrase n=1 Tax=Bosea sp. (in: a-proteobacteria) TaxID=1871050 RepID=UPI0027371B64|nr:tyrosine-type recombinase/integrase [Bosea sp. (in: a-proteobacteria)]MDP3257829.1 tyrosine-type recombinase/integrase [Bosea sp. (in: a-proteobacteria)]